MNDKLDKQLCEKYPKIFQDRHGDMRNTCMCWGFECGDGWYALIDELCHQIQWRIDNPQQVLIPSFYNTLVSVARWFCRKLKLPYKLTPRFRLKKIEVPQVLAVQVKEKFGGLRFYFRGGNDEISNYVHFAEAISYRICEECGTTNTAKRRGGGWIMTLCDECEEKLKKEKEAKS